MPKIFENVTMKLSQVLKNIIINEQHGFMNSRSTFTNLVLYHDYIVTILEEGLQVDAVYIDFKKAFDSVNHDLNQQAASSRYRWKSLGMAGFCFMPMILRSLEESQI